MLRNPSICARIQDLQSALQFLLPWGLYATDRLLEAEAKRRSLPYDNQLRLLAYLADAGVPTFDALRLVSLQFERADATRLATRYQQAGGLKTGMDIAQWVIAQPLQLLVEWVRGNDQRRVDFDFERRIQDLRLLQ